MRRRHEGEQRQVLLSEKTSEFERLGALEALRLRCAQAYDAERAEHVRALKDLWAAAFPGEPYTLPSERWKDLGFQGTDPRTDLRGAGFLGLAQLQALLTQHGAGLLGLQDDLPPELSNLPLAISSINCTAMLLSHLQLAPKLACAFLPGGGRGAAECPPETLHAFLSLGWEGSGAESDADGGAESASRAELSPARATVARVSAADEADEAAAVRRLLCVLNAMHGRLVWHLGRTWLRMSAEPTTTLMDFPTALRDTYAHLQRALRAAGGAPWRLDAVCAQLENEVAPAPLLESFGPLTEAVGAYSSWALSFGWSLSCSAYNAVVGMCFTAPADDVAHDKRM